jgi:hypothetical protein
MKFNKVFKEEKGRKKGRYPLISNSKNDTFVSLNVLIYSKIKSPQELTRPGQFINTFFTSYVLICTVNSQLTTIKH